MEKQTILIVDDNDFSRNLLAEILEEDYNVVEAANGKQAISLITDKDSEVAAVLLDLVMPEMDGLQVIEEIANLGLGGKLPILVISGESETEIKQRCFELGVFDFIHKPYNPMLAKLRVKNAMELYNYQNSLEKKISEKAAQLTKMNEQIIELMGNMVEARNHESGTHIHRVKAYTRIIAQKLMELYPEYKITKEDIELITSASALHDMGKIMIPDSILLKPGRLTPAEFDIMKTHSKKGCDIIDSAPLDFDPKYRQFAHDITLYHHERFDGMGYPEGLVGDEIPICAQIVAVADCCDALSTDRVYKKAYSMDQTFEMITSGTCGEMNPKIIRCFCECKKDIVRIHSENTLI